MAFPTDTNIAADAANELILLCRNLRLSGKIYVDQCDAGAVNINQVYNRFLGGQLASAKTRLAILMAVPGIFDELARMKPGSFVNAAAAQTAVQEVQTALNTIITQLETDAPVDASNRLLVTIAARNGSGQVTDRTITAAGPLATFRGYLVAFRDAFAT